MVFGTIRSGFVNLDAGDTTECISSSHSYHVAAVKNDESSCSPIFFGNRLKYCDDIGRDELFEFELSDEEISISNNSSGGKSDDITIDPSDLSFILNGKYGRKYNAKGQTSATVDVSSCGTGLAFIFLSLFENGLKMKTCKAPNPSASLTNIFPTLSPSSKKGNSFTAMKPLSKSDHSHYLILPNGEPSTHKFQEGEYFMALF
jgi:hypothetical protein